MIKLEQQAIIVSATAAEHEDSVAKIEANYGPGGPNAGKITYVINNTTKTITITNTINDYQV